MQNRNYAYSYQYEPPLILRSSRLAAVASVTAILALLAILAILLASAEAILFLNLAAISLLLILVLLVCAFASSNPALIFAQNASCAAQNSSADIASSDISSADIPGTELRVAISAT
jgi:hypothetical protein